MAVSALSRVRDVVAVGSGEVAYSLDFLNDEEFRPVVRGSLQGLVALLCQRCLQIMDYPLQSSFALGVVVSDDLAGNLPASLEPLVVPEDLVDIEQIIEDEILLCLPLVAFHAEEACAVAPGFVSADESVKTAETSRPNPFEGLAALKKE